MFGYVRTDRPNLYIKDDILYKAMYCGLCKGISCSAGQCARMGLSYDVTFLSVILHNITGQDVTITKQRCLSHPLTKKLMANVDFLTEQLGAINTELVYYKYTDDIRDGDKGRGKRLWFVRGHKRVKAKYPQINKIIKDNLAEQEKLEKANVDSIDRAADATANMLAELSDYLLEGKGTEFTRTLFYSLGKWIYLIDALDDYDKDKKKGAYNPFVLSYGAENRAELLEKNGQDVEFVFNAIFYDIREALTGIEFKFNRDLTDNVLLKGLPKMTKRILAGHSCRGYDK